MRAIKSLEKMGEILVTRPKTGCFHTNHYIIMIDCGRNGAREHQTGSNIESNTKAPHLRKCDGKAPASDTMSPAEVTWSHLPSDTDAHGKRKLEIHKPVKGKKERELPDRCRSSWGKRIPEIRDYSDIHDPNEDPISIAISITGEKTIRAWGYWVKMLKKAQDELGKEKTERLFRGCLVELWGKMKAGECNKPGAMLNILLQETFEARYGGDKGK